MRKMQELRSFCCIKQTVREFYLAPTKCLASQQHVPYDLCRQIKTFVYLYTCLHSFVHMDYMHHPAKMHANAAAKTDDMTNCKLEVGIFFLSIVMMYLHY